MSGICNTVFTVGAGILFVMLLAGFAVAAYIFSKVMVVVALTIIGLITMIVVALYAIAAFLPNKE